MRASRNRFVRLFGVAATALLWLASGQATAHEYFVGTSRKPQNENRISPGATLEVAPGGTIQLLVEDGIGCRADLTATMADTAIATVTPGTASRRVAQLFTIRAGQTPGITTLTVRVQGVGQVAIGGGRGSPPEIVECDEDSTNTFTICVSSGSAQQAGEFARFAKGAKKEFNRAVKAKLADLRAKQTATLGRLRAGELTVDDAIRQLQADMFDTGQDLKKCWFDTEDAVGAEGRRILTADGAPVCGSVAQDFSYGGGGVWDTFRADIALCIRQAADRMDQDFRRLKEQARNTPAAGVNSQPGLTNVSTVNRGVERPANGTAPSGTTPPPVQTKPVNIGTVTATRSRGSSTGSVDVSGTAQPGVNMVEVRLRGNGEHTRTVPVDPTTCRFTVTIAGVLPGDYLVQARYEGDGSESSDAELVTLQ